MPFDPASAYRIGPGVAIRSEAFGAIAYDYGTRKLFFLKPEALVAVVRQLDDHQSAADAVASVTSAPGSMKALLAALGRLSDAGMIRAP